VLHPGAEAHVANFSAYLVEAAELEPRPTPGLGLRQTLRLPMLLARTEVEGELVGEIRVEPAPPEQADDPQTHPGQHSFAVPHYS
jgi:hypothetical protein